MNKCVLLLLQDEHNRIGAKGLRVKRKADGEWTVGDHNIGDISRAIPLKDDIIAEP